jgi:hypothetical protein
MPFPVQYPVKTSDLKRGTDPTSVGGHALPCSVDIPALNLVKLDSIAEALLKIYASTIGALNYQGVWDASTNTPMLSDATGTKGHYYVVSVGGTQDLGSGPISFSPGDWVVHNGTIWQKADHTDVVTSVFGRQGAVVAVASDYDASQVDNDSSVTGATVKDALNTLLAAYNALLDYTPDVVTGTISFAASDEEDIVIVLGRQTREILRGRLYISADPGSGFAAHATVSFYNKAAKHGADAFYRTWGKLVYTELEVATTGSDANITPDDQTDFSPNDLAVILDTSDEFVRLATIADTMVAEDTVGAHAINTGLSRIMEFSGFQLFNYEGANNVYMRVKFEAVQTVSLKVELVLGR